MRECTCEICGNPFIAAQSRRNPRFCSHACAVLGQRRCIHPPRDILAIMIQQMPVTSIGIAYGVSDNAVRKWCKRYGLETRPRGYWAKVYAQQGTEKTKPARTTHKRSPVPRKPKLQVAAKKKRRNRSPAAEKLVLPRNADINAKFAPFGELI